MQLGSETVKACYNCRSEDNLKEWSESDFICTKCYEEDAAILKKFRAERSFTYPEIDMIE